jgi:hypothetical protein
VPGFCLCLVLVGQLWAQSSQVLTVAPPPRTAGARNAEVTAGISVQLLNGYHVNSNTPNDSYLVPLRLSWNASPLRVLEITYPQPRLETLSFSTKPVSVNVGDFRIGTRFKVPATAPLGAAVLTGKLRYQACTASSCLAPRTVEVRLPVEIRAQ